MAIRGYIERVSPEFIEGWCYDEGAPKTALAVTLRINGETVASGMADQLRPDLADAGYGSGHHAFQFAGFDCSLIDGEPTIEVWATHSDSAGFTALPRLQPRSPMEQWEPATEPAVPPGRRQGLRCLLHIGLEKAGSSSLQRYLVLNREALLEQGVLVPVSLAQNDGRDLLNHSSLVAYALDASKETDELRRLHGCGSRALLSRFRETVQECLTREVEKAPEQTHLLVLSNEHLHSRLRDASEIERLKRLLDSVCEDAQVLVYLRPQHRIAVSAHATLLKNGALLENPFPVPDPEVPWTETELIAYYDQDDVIARWERVFGSGSVHPIRLNRPIEDMILDHLPVDPAEFIPLEERANVGLSPDGLAILRALNEELRDLPHDQAQHIRNELISLLERHYGGFGAVGYGSEAQTFQERFSESNERLRQRHFPELRELYEPDWAIYSDADREPRSDAIATIAIMRQLVRTIGLNATSPTPDRCRQT